MNALTRFDTAALNRALVGFDRIFDNFETRFANQINNNYPPYNIKKISENKYVIEMAVAGFRPQLEQRLTNLTNRIVQADRHLTTNYRQIRRAVTTSSNVICL